MTKQEQTEKIMCMFNKLKRGDYCVDNCYGCCGDEKIDITCHDVVVNFIQSLMQAGYGDISEYKAEREMLGSQIKVLKQRLNDKYIEIDRLKAENETYCKQINQAYDTGYDDGYESCQDDIKKADELLKEYEK